MNQQYNGKMFLVHLHMPKSELHDSSEGTFSLFLLSYPSLFILLSFCSCSVALFSPDFAWAWRPASAVRCSLPPVRCNPAADETPWTCTPWCHRAADSSGAPPSGCSIKPEEIGRERRRRAVNDHYFNLLGPSVRDAKWLDIVALV